MEAWFAKSEYTRVQAARRVCMEYIHLGSCLSLN